MNKQESSRFRNVSNDPRLLFWFAIILMLAMYAWSYFQTPHLLQPAYFLIFSVLFALHIFLHWKFNWVAKHHNWLVRYALVQGLLAFAITYLSGNVGMVFCLFMALIGELLAIYHLTVMGILTSVYLLILAFINFSLMLGLKQAGWFILGTIPTIIFVAIYVILYTRQAEANEHARALLVELQAANLQLTEYAARIEDLTIVSERQRLARELHDTLSQGLAGLILQLEAADAHLAGARPERTRAILKQSMDTARQTLAQARLAIDDLRHDTQRDLEQVVRQEIDHFIHSTGIPCTSEIEFPENIPEQISATIIRVTTEALTNIARHAHAHNARVRITNIEKKTIMELAISDDGVGFNPKQVKAGHFGLLGMRERVRLAGGTLDIHSEVGNGTQILIRCPLTEHNLSSPLVKAVQGAV